MGIILFNLGIIVLLGTYLYFRTNYYCQKGVLSYLIVFSFLPSLFYFSFLLLVPSFLIRRYYIIFLILQFFALELGKWLIFIYKNDKYFRTRDPYDLILYSIFLSLFSNLFISVLSPVLKAPYNNSLLNVSLSVLTGLYMGYYLEMAYQNVKRKENSYNKLSFFYSLFFPFIIRFIYSYLLNLLNDNFLYFVFIAFNLIIYYLIYYFIVEKSFKEKEALIIMSQKGSKSFNLQEKDNDFRDIINLNE